MNSQQFYSQQNQINPNGQMPQMMQQFYQMMQPSQENYRFQIDFPRAQNYNDLQDIIKHFPHLKKIINNNSEFNISQSFIVRSSNDDDIHKAIKYNVWTSTTNNNVILQKAYDQAKSQGKDVLLFFSVVKSGQFVGVAKMASGFINKKFPLWWQNHKFNQQFELEWQYIKDVSNKQLYSIKNIDGNPITKSRDCNEIDINNSILTLETFKNSNQQYSIFQDFAFMDMREDQLRNHIQIQSQRNQQDQ